VIEVLTARVNNAPAPGEFRVVAVVPENAQSAYAVDQVEVNIAGPPAHATVDPWQMRVTYDTLVGYDEVQALVLDRFERVLASNPLVRGYTPVYITLNVAYRLRVGATTPLDEEAVEQAVAVFINTFDLTKTLDLSAIMEHARANFPDLGVIVSPTILTYDLFAPDGQVYSYQTNDIVTVYPEFPSNNAHLTNGSVTSPTALRVPIENADLDPTLNPLAIPSNATLFAAANKTLEDQLTELGVSDRTLIYLTSADDINFTLVS
jgi:hypothetical protein